MRKSRLLIAVSIFAPLSTFLFTTTSGAASASISVKSMTLITKVSGSETPLGLLVKHKNIYVFGTIVGFVSTDGYLQALDENGVEKWKVFLDSGGNDIATSGVVDQAGNIWVAGSTSLATAEPTSAPAPVTTLLNPDSVTVETDNPIRQDSSVISVWKISPSGNLLANYSVDVKRAVLVKAITITSGSVTVVGVTATALGSAGFLIQSTLDGIFGKIVLIGKSNTQINGIIKEGKDLILLGSSSEKLYSKPVSGIQDGIILTFSSTGEYLSLIRSFNSESSRTWRSATSNNFFGGAVTTGKKIEAVLTKYSSKFAPSWTSRYSSLGTAYVIDSTPITHIALFSSTEPITGVKGWKASKGALIALYLDKNGLLSSAYRAAGMSRLLAVGLSQELGVVVLARGQFGVSIFHALSL